MGIYRIVARTRSSRLYNRRGFLSYSTYRGYFVVVKGEVVRVYTTKPNPFRRHTVKSYDRIDSED